MTATRSFIDTYAEPTNTATPSFSVGLGTAAASRIIVVGVVGESAAATINSVTLDGNAMTEAIQGDLSGNTAGIFYRAVPTGTTATVAVTFSASKNRSGVAVWAMYGALLTPYDTDGAGGSATTVSVTSFTSPPGGVVFGVACKTAATITSWTNLTLDESLDLEAGNAFISGASKETATGSAGETISAVSSGSNRCRIAVVSFSPSVSLPPSLRRPRFYRRAA